MTDEELTGHFAGVTTQFKNLDKRFDSVDKRFDTVDKRLDTVDQRLDTIDQRLDAMDSRFTAHEQANEKEFRAIETTFLELRMAVAEHVGQLRIEMIGRFDRMERRFDGFEDKLDRALASRARPVKRSAR